MKLKTVAKKVLSGAVIGAMVLSLTACGGGSSSADSGSDSGSQESSEDTGNEESSASGESGGSDVTLKFQQWWGAELPEGYLDDIVAKYKEETGVTVELLTEIGRAHV